MNGSRCQIGDCTHLAQVNSPASEHHHHGLSAAPIIRSHDLFSSFSDHEFLPPILTIAPVHLKPSSTMPTPPSHLIVVCCHGICLGGPDKGHNESEWLIASFQEGETRTFIRHIRAGLEALSDQKPGHSVLCFSG